MTSPNSTTPTITYTHQHSKGFLEPPTQRASIYALDRLKNEQSDNPLVIMENSRPDGLSWAVKKWHLQDIARTLVPQNHATRKCMCWRIPGQSVEIHVDQANETAHYRNVMTCKNVWVCPVCSSRITERRAKELQTMLDGTNYQTVMTTFTMSHSRGDKLRFLLEDQQAAISAFKSGRWWQDLCKQWGIVGTIKALETTWGPAAGWHPHIHELWIIDLNKPLTEAQSRHLQKLLVSRWQRMLLKVARVASDEHGVHVSENALDQYIAKFGKQPKGEKSKWTLARELSKAASKRTTDKEHLTPFQILERAPDDKQMAAIFQEYVEAMKGKQQLRWSTGLRDLLGLEDEAEEMETYPDAEKLLTIPDAHWQSVCNQNKRGELLKISGTGNLSRTRLFINICHYRELAKIEPGINVIMHRKHPEYGKYE